MESIRVNKKIEISDESIKRSVFDTVEYRLHFLETSVKAVIETVDKKGETFFLKNSRSKKLYFLNPVSVIFTYDCGDAVIEAPDFDVYGVGDTKQEAIIDFTKNLETLYFELKKVGNKKLGTHMLTIWNFMKENIREYDPKSKANRKGL